MKEAKIDLSWVIDKREVVLVGRDNGVKALKRMIREGFDLEQLESANDVIIVQIPKHVVSMNRSYFLGMFETSVERLGRKGFEDKYKFDTSKHIQEKIKDHIEKAILNASQEDILNG